MPAKKRKSYQEIEAQAYKAAHDLVDRIQPVWIDSMTPEQAATATKEVILTTLHAVSRATQAALPLEDRSIPSGDA